MVGRDRHSARADEVLEPALVFLGSSCPTLVSAANQQVLLCQQSC